MKIAIYSHTHNANTIEAINTVVEALVNAKQEVMLFEPLKLLVEVKLLNPSYITFFSTSDELSEQVDAFFSIGGDGTILHSITLIKDSNIPILGINTGRMGFLANTAKADLIKTIEQVINRSFTLEKRSLIEMHNITHDFGQLNFALNEFSIVKERAPSMIKLNVFIDGVFLNSYWADGLVVATPTGSTGYSLSCGGPIITPDSRTFIITPIASHNLNVRPLILPDHKIITIVFEEPGKQVILGLDSRSSIISNPIEITLKKAAFEINLIKLANQNFFKTIREKLLWGLDIRN